MNLVSFIKKKIRKIKEAKNVEENINIEEISNVEVNTNKEELKAQEKKRIEADIELFIKMTNPENGEAFCERKSELID